MKIKCIENHMPDHIVGYSVGDILDAIKIEGSEAYDIKDNNGTYWCLEPYLGKYAILTGGYNFTSLKVVAKFEEVANKEPKILKLNS